MKVARNTYSLGKCYYGVFTVLSGGISFMSLLRIFVSSLFPLRSLPINETHSDLYEVIVIPTVMFNCNI